MNESLEYRSLGYCKFCNEEIFGTHHNKIQAHQRFCKCNPNRSKSLIQISNASKNAAKKEVRNKASKTKKINSEKTYKIYTFKCKNPKCQKEFTRKLKIKQFESEYRIPQYCCHSCANSHVHTDEIKKKIGKSVAKEHWHICPKCKNKFSGLGTARHKLCDACFELIFGCSRQDSLLNTNACKLHAVNCPQCGKILWVKTMKTVYCYECCNILHKRKRQLFTEFGHKLVSTETRKKLHDNMHKRIKDGTHKGWMTRNKTSYAEKFFIKVLDSYGIKYEREVRTPRGYFLDFVIALKNGLKIDLEIDGKQHTYENRLRHDKKTRYDKSFKWIFSLQNSMVKH